MGTCIYTTGGNSFYTPMPYDKVKCLLLLKDDSYVEVPVARGNEYMIKVIKVGNITCVERELPGKWEEMQ